MAYDSRRGRIVLFGGVAVSGVLDDTWEWDGTSWAQVARSGPAGRGEHVLAYDSDRDRTVLFGGEARIALGYRVFDDTWEWDGNSWSQVQVDGPPGRRRTAMVYDERHGACVLFGGLSSESTLALADTWEYRNGFPATARPFGSGCGSPALGLSPVAGSSPILGTTARLGLSDLPATAAAVSLGLSNTTFSGGALPYSLTGLGLTGCDLLQSGDLGALGAAPMGSGTATCSLQIPYWPDLLGVSIYAQGVALAPGANPAGAVVSNGVEWVVGEL